MLYCTRAYPLCACSKITDVIVINSGAFCNVAHSDISAIFRHDIIDILVVGDVGAISVDYVINVAMP